MPDLPIAYPGDTATPEQIIRLAEDFRAAAHLLLQIGRRGDPLSRAPFRLAAIHAIELYLSALLRFTGHETAQVRAMHHDLATRAQMAATRGLRLRHRTVAHLAAMTEGREYLVTRYGPEMTATVSQINRLTATLDEVAVKVRGMMSVSDKDGS